MQACKLSRESRHRFVRSVCLRFMKRDRGRLNSRTRETRNIPSLMPSLAVLRVTRRMRSMHTMASTASWVVLAAGPPPAGLGRGRPAPAHGHASPVSFFFVISPVRPVLSTFNFTSKAVQNRLEGHRTGVHINTVPTARGTRAIPFRRTFPGHRTSFVSCRVTAPRGVFKPVSLSAHG